MVSPQPLPAPLAIPQCPDVLLESLQPLRPSPNFLFKSTQSSPANHIALLDTAFPPNSSCLPFCLLLLFCVSPIRASRSSFNTRPRQIAFSSELMYADLPALAFLALRRHCEKIVLAAESEAFKSRLWARLLALRAPAVMADPRKPASSSLHRTLAPLNLF